jgi:hypothetical protein
MARFSAKKTGFLGPNDQFSGRSTGLFEGLFERIARRFGIQAKQKPVPTHSSCAQNSSRADSEGTLASSLCPRCEAPIISDETCTECLWDWAIK